MLKQFLVQIFFREVHSFSDFELCKAVVVYFQPWHVELAPPREILASHHRVFRNLSADGFQVQLEVGFFYESPRGQIIQVEDVAVQSFSFDRGEEVFLQRLHLFDIGLNQLSSRFI